ncbi:MAG: ferrochelatase [Gammaproteobacteria bacterium]|nr:ferrochelatase [Gammaproteobacteria bacterium]
MNKQNNQRIGVLVVNLGTPSEPTAGAVFKYLAQFLSDKRVIDLPAIAWRTLLYGLILPLRSPKVAKLYQQIWTEHGSPLRYYNEAITEKLATSFQLSNPDQILCLSAMSYGQPSIAKALAEFERQQIKKIVVLPLFPQYSATTTAVVYDQIAAVLTKTRYLPEIRMVMDYCDKSEYITALADNVRASRAQSGNPASQLLLMSFHGMPQRYVDAGDPYQAQCQRTAEALATELGLNADQWKISYQSRFGKAQWLTPYTDSVLRNLPDAGVNNIDIICPAFAVDCLETLEETAVENKEIYQHAGGQGYTYVPALNDQENHVAILKQLIDQQMLGWPLK